MDVSISIGIKIQYFRPSDFPRTSLFSEKLIESDTQNLLDGYMHLDDYYNHNNNGNFFFFFVISNSFLRLSHLNNSYNLATHPKLSFSKNITFLTFHTTNSE